MKTMTMMQRAVKGIAVTMVLMLGACGGPEGDSPDQGRASFAISGGIPAPQASQCNSRDVPAPAKATGLTKLAFCDDFKHPEKSFDLTDAAWNPNVNWSRKRPFNKYSVTPVSAISISDGVLRLEGTGDSWIMTSALQDGEVQGFSINKEKEWYVEVKWRFEENYPKPTDNPAFWSMDSCWLWKSPLCSGKFIEPDFFETMNGNDVHGTHLHYWDSKNKMTTEIKCNGVKTGSAGDYTQWHTRALHVNPNEHEGRQVYYYNEQVQVDRTWDKVACKDMITGKPTNGEFLKDLDEGSYPLIIKPGINTVVYIDYVRVWVKPGQRQQSGQPLL